MRIGSAVKVTIKNRKGYFEDMEQSDEGFFDGTIPLTPYIRPVCLPCSGAVTNDMLVDVGGESLLNGDETEEQLCTIEGKRLFLFFTAANACYCPGNMII